MDKETYIAQERVKLDSKITKTTGLADTLYLLHDANSETKFELDRVSKLVIILWDNLTKTKAEKDNLRECLKVAMACDWKTDDLTPFDLDDLPENPKKARDADIAAKGAGLLGRYSSKKLLHEAYVDSLSRLEGRDAHPAFDPSVEEPSKMVVLRDWLRRTDEGIKKKTDE